MVTEQEMGNATTAQTTATKLEAALRRVDGRIKAWADTSECPSPKSDALAKAIILEDVPFLMWHAYQAAAYIKFDDKVLAAARAVYPRLGAVQIGGGPVWCPFCMRVWDVWDTPTPDFAKFPHGDNCPAVALRTLLDGTETEEG